MSNNNTFWGQRGPDGRTYNLALYIRMKKYLQSIISRESAGILRSPFNIPLSGGIESYHETQPNNAPVTQTLSRADCEGQSAFKQSGAGAENISLKNI